MNSSLITYSELVSAMFESADACLKSFGKLSGDKAFCAFGIETYALYGYYHMALNNHEDFEEYAEKCKGVGISKEDIEDEKWGNPQSWKLFSFNDDNDSWNYRWSAAKSRIEATLELLREEEDEDALEQFFDEFKRAGVESLRMLEEQGSFAAIRTTDDFKTLVYDHSDVF